MKTLLLLQLSLSLILEISGGEHGHNSESQHSAEAQMDFALKIYQSIAPLSESCPANLFISPVSIYTTLSMLALGARSTTRREILQGMGPNDPETDEELHEGHKKLLQVLSHQSKDVKFHLGNNLFVDQSANILQEYRHKVAHYYNASIQTVRFRDPQTAEKTINMLVRDRTDRRIQNVAGNSKTSMVLLDYAVFEAKWKSEFKKKHTEMRPFMRGPTPVSVPMMYRVGVYKTYRDMEMNADVVKIPYGGNTDLLIIVPQLGDLRRMEQELTPQRVTKYLHSVKSSVVELYIPKISFSTAVSLERAFLHMDMAIIFDKNKADFSGISETQKLSVSSVWNWYEGKMKTLLLLPFFISPIIATHTSKLNEGQNSNLSPKRQDFDLSEAQMKFALRIYKRFSPLSARPQPNIFFSPVSVYTTLSMLALGARSTTRMKILQSMGLSDTKTNEELNEGNRKLLQVISQSTKDVEFKIGNEIFIDNSTNILLEYQYNAARYYNASVQTVSFSDPQNAEKLINKIVSNRSDQKIQNAISDLDSKTSMVLLDYVVFRAKWKSEFEKENTEKRKFMVKEERPISVPMMRRRRMYKTYKDTAMGCEVVEVPYFRNISLLIIVPKLGDVFHMEQQLTPQRIKTYLRSMKTSLLDLYIPKLSFNTPVNVAFGLLDMEMGIMGSENPDFSGISEKEKLRVSAFIHQSSMDMDEGGTEARSAADAQWNLALEGPEFRIDRPFLMLLYHKVAKIFLGMGRIMNPLWSQNTPSPSGALSHLHTGISGAQ